MKDAFDDLFDELDGYLIVLQNTTEITEEIAGSDPWKDLLPIYQDAKTANKRGVVSCLNSVLTHGRVYFGMSKKCTAMMVRNDKNHPPSSGFSNCTYKTLRLYLQRKYIRLFHSGSKGKRGIDIFEVIHPDLRKHLSSNDLEKQKKEAILFSCRLGNKSDKSQDKGNSNKNEESRTTSKKSLSQQEVEKSLSQFDDLLLSSCRELYSEGRIIFSWIYRVIDFLSTLDSGSQNNIVKGIEKLEDEYETDEGKILFERINPILKHYLKFYKQTAQDESGDQND